jgi:hypothetical protein
MQLSGMRSSNRDPKKKAIGCQSLQAKEGNGKASSMLVHASTAHAMPADAIMHQSANSMRLQNGHLTRAEPCE